MGFLAIAKVMLLAAVAGQIATPAVAQTQQLPEPITTRQNFFAIPFRIERAESPEQEAAEVQLYVSGDRGKTWQLYSKLGPAQRQFLFRSACDGEFWFIVRTLDRSNHVRPEGVKGPELRVIVDTVPPVLSLEAKAGQGGQVTATWQVEEVSPKLDTLNIQYRSSSTEPWKTVAIDHHEKPSEGSLQSGEATWLPAIAGGSLEIRAEITDAAGNSAVSHAQLQLSQDTADANCVWRPALGSPVAAPSDREEPKPKEISKNTESPASVAKNAPFDAAKNAAPPDALPPVSPAGPQDAAVAAKVGPAYQNKYDDHAAASATVPAVARDWPYWVAKKLFDLTYDVTSIGPSGLGRVEVWGTRDAGHTWKCFAVDNDNVSPITVGVDDEGVYGFRVVMQSRGGAGGEPPRSGDIPQQWIGVDCTQPIVKIVATQDGSGPDGGTLAISWQAADQNLAAQPISLFYSQEAGGVWMPIVAGVENSGRFVWSLPQDLPPEIFLRVEARDMAGNVGIGQNREAVRLNPMRVSAQSHVAPPLQLPITPAAEASRAEPKRYYFK